MHRLTPPGLVMTLLAVFCAPAILFAAPPAEREYRVTVQPGEAVNGARAIAEQMAASYGGTLGEADGQAGDAFVVRLSESRARVLSADPRVKSVVPMGPGTAAANAVVEAVAWSSGVSYSYDSAGNVKQVGSDRFAYDHVNRLVQATMNGVTRKYEYDAFGNRMGCTQFGQNDCQAFTINTAENKNRITQASYDAAGNVVTQSNHAYSYDALNMMTRDTYGQLAREFVYTAADERIATYTVGSSWRWTLRDTSGKVLREFSSADAPGGLGTANWKWEKDYVWRDGLLLASRQPDGAGTTTYHYHLDHLGTPRRITDNGDQIVGVHDYYAFGPEASAQVQEFSPSSLKYTGHERDGWGLDYMHARYYDSDLGRFLSVDAAMPRMDQPQALNRYAYGRDNPLKYVDPTGRTVGLATNCADNKSTCQELKDLRDTVPPEMRIFIQATVKDGHAILNSGLMRLGASKNTSGNFFALSQLANSNDTVQFRSSVASFSHYYQGKPMGETFAPITPEAGFYGQTVIASDSLSRQNQVFVNPFMSDFDRASTTAHELYGHMRLYMFGRPWEHSTKTVWDEKMQAFTPDPNTNVERVIRSAASEAERNAQHP